MCPCGRRGSPLESAWIERAMGLGEVNREIRII
jgi:hypothetical protein